MKIGITNLIERDGITLRHEAGTNGGELAGPCPFCGGKDRFRVWPEKGRYWCRQCGGRGDSIRYLRDRHGMGYREACEALGIEPSLSARQETAATPPKPPADEWLSVEWQMAAWAFLTRCREDLQRSSGAMAYLKGRGLNDETISSLGLNASTAHVDRAAWGLPPETDAKTGKLKRLWLPRGIVIPAFDGDLIHRLRIRLHPDESKKTKAWTGGRWIRYAEVSGSGNDPLFLPGKDGAGAWAVVESELDAYLVHQEAGDLVNVLGLGSTTGKPTAQTLKAMAGKKVLLCLDHDAAGWKTLGVLPGEYWPTPEGKDPGEYFQTGGSIRSWIEAGLEPEPPKTERAEDPPALKDAESPPERQDDHLPPLGAYDVDEIGRWVERCENAGIVLDAIVQPGALQAAGDPVRDGEAGAIEEDKGLSLPCGNPKFRCYHLRGGQCHYRQNWGPVTGLGTCPMIEGAGTGYAHPEVRRLERQQAEHGLDPELPWIYGANKCT